MNETTLPMQVSPSYKTTPFRSEIKLKEILGEGGMGKVFLGHQSYPHRHVAVKKLHTFSHEAQELLLHEALITGKLEHPNIVPIHEIVYKGDTQSIEVVMRRIDGITLLSYLQDPTFSLSRAIQALIQVSYALEFAHSQHIIHRDIKPENIMF